MAWGEVKVETQRKSFIDDVLSARSTFSELCRHYQISRKTGYKWLNRYELEGEDGLSNQSRAPHSTPHETEDYVKEEIIKARICFPTLGPKKIHARLVKSNPEISWPCANTMGNILDEAGLVERRKIRRRVAHRPFISIPNEQSNDLWCVDFKGTIKTLNGEKCNPFTLTDSWSRFILKCTNLDHNNTKHVWGVLSTAFREYGLPEHILSDNGPPFGCTGAGRITRLTINIIKCGVKPLWITPGKPQQNGRHERMHGTLSRELKNESIKSSKELNTRLRTFQDFFNFERPHEALGQKMPSEMYMKSHRSWNGRVESPEYSQDYEVRKVDKCGLIYWKGHRIFIGEAFYKEPVGVIKGENALEVYFGDIYLGCIDDDYKLHFIRRKSKD